MKTIAIIPARGGSKRLVNKNILDLGGIPLVAHSIIYARKNHHIIDEVFVSTDDEVIKKIAVQFGAKVIDRPSCISGDFEPTVTALQHALNSIEYAIERVILLQPTNPFRPEALLDDAFNVYLKENCDSLLTVSRNHRKFGKIVENRFKLMNYSSGDRSQDLDPLYFENGLLYISDSKLIQEGKIFSENGVPFDVESVFANIDIDSQEDLDYARYIMQVYGL